MKICPKCEKRETDKKFCDVCYADILEITPNHNYDIIKCDFCNSSFLKNKKYKNPDEQTFVSILVNSIKLNKNYNIEIENVEVTFYNYDKKPIEYNLEDVRHAIVYIDFEVDIKEFEKIDKKYNVRKAFEFKILNNKCRDCGRVHANYFEGILQVRFESEERISKFVLNLMDKYKEIVNKVAEDENGIDFYVTDKKQLANMSSTILNNIVGEEKTTATLFSRNAQTSRDIYRTKYLTKLKNLIIGDYVSYKNTILKIIKIRKKEIIGRCLEKNQNMNITKHLSEIDRVKDFHEVQVIKQYPEVEILDPIDFTNKKLKNLKETNKDKIKVIIRDFGVYAIGE